MKSELLSLGYRGVRQQVISHTHRVQKIERIQAEVEIKKELAEKKIDVVQANEKLKEAHEKYPVPHLEDAVLIGANYIKQLPKWFTEFDIPENIDVNLYDLHFPSPLVLSSFQEDMQVINRWVELGLGGAIIKSVMEEPRKGNAKPRLQELTEGEYKGCIANRMGLPGPGIQRTIYELNNSNLFEHERPIGLSVGGSTIEEYKRNFDKLNDYVENDKSDSQIFYEVNISCPNTPEGQDMAKHPELLKDLLEYMRFRTNKVIGVKLSPAMPNEDLVKFAKIIQSFEKTYVNIGNTMPKKKKDVGLKEEEMSGEPFGVSGHYLYPRTKEMVEVVSKNVPGLPIIATGGISKAEQYLELRDIAKRNGTETLLVAAATAIVKDMYMIPKFNKRLENLKWWRENGRSVDRYATGLPGISF